MIQALKYVSSHYHNFLHDIVLKNGSLTKETIGELQLLLSLVFFAISFVGKRQAMINGMKPISYNVCRFIVSTLVILFTKYVVGLSIERERSPGSEDKHAGEGASAKAAREAVKLNKLLIFGSILGFANFGASIFQQEGLVTVTAGKAGFITGMYVVFVPIAEFFAPCFKYKLTYRAVFAALTSLVGLFLLSGCAETENCLNGEFNRGELLVFLSVFFWVISIMSADIGCKQTEIISLQLVDFAVTTVLSIILALCIEPSSLHQFYPSFMKNWHLILLVGVSEAAAFILSSLGQIYSTPSRAALLYSLETVTSAIFAYLFLNERLTYVELLGAFVMFVAALVTSTAPGDADESENISNQDEIEPMLHSHEYRSGDSVEMANIRNSRA